jgi:hypothetical protein
MPVHVINQAGEDRSPRHTSAFPHRSPQAGRQCPTHFPGRLRPSRSVHPSLRKVQNHSGKSSKNRKPPTHAVGAGEWEEGLFPS